ncbi:hypothetical protein FGO68_gene8160 [Halteria grandinella]|uniref:FAD-binding domain-containing protein n=1 Tax=Halteria grandinella TaxID=5974 RepID=A0A8J8NSY0_HALGN|nr:hypothetical protein FGO68_gene8160 [Halteria grandinella]
MQQISQQVKSRGKLLYHTLRAFSSSNSEGTQVQKTDVLIVGGGIAGASLACALSQSEYFQSTSSGLKRIVMLDHTKLPSISDYATHQRTPEPRVITLTPNSLRFLSSIGGLQLCNATCVTPFKEMLVYEEIGHGFMRFDIDRQRSESRLIKAQEELLKRFVFDEEHKRAFEATQVSMGASVENNHLLAALINRAKTMDKCDIIQKKVVAVKRAVEASGRPRVILDDGSIIEADLIVGSDGEKSKTREEYGIQATGYSYEQSGLVCTVSSLSRPNTIAYQRFLKSGPLALLPLWDNYSSIVWSCPPEMCKELQDLSDTVFIDTLNKALQKTPEQAFGGFNLLPKSMRMAPMEHPPILDKVHTKRFAFPLILQHSNSYAGNRMALIGDAAHRIHPMAGQGLNLGITDVAYLANSIVKAKKSGLDIGNYDLVLKDYETKAKANAYSMISAIEVVRNSYQGKLAGSETAGNILSLFRNLAIDTIQMSELAKYNFMNFASGNLTHPVSYEWEYSN